MSIEFDDTEAVEPEVVPVQRQDVLSIWHLVRGYLKEATDRSHSRMTIDDLLLEVLTGDSILWVIFDRNNVWDIYGAATTRVVQYPNVKAVSGDFCGGKDVMIWSKALEDAVIEYARKAGARQVEIYGRRGWVKAFRPGWDAGVVMMTKRI